MEDRPPKGLVTEEKEEGGREVSVKDTATTKRDKFLKPINKRHRSMRQPINILIVDDTELNLKVASMIFHRLGINATFVNSGQDALDSLEKKNFDIVFMDVIMPGMDGYEMTKKIRQLYNTRDIIIIAMTAGVMPGDREKCIEVGMNDYIEKPVTTSKIQDILEKWSPKMKIYFERLQIAMAKEIKEPSPEDTSSTEDESYYNPTDTSISKKNKLKAE